MPRYTLKNSCGKWSSGTEVEILNEQALDYGTSYRGRGIVVSPVISTDPQDYFDVPIEQLITRRERTKDIAIPTRRERRRGLDTLHQLEQNA